MLSEGIIVQKESSPDSLLFTLESMEELSSKAS